MQHPKMMPRSHYHRPHFPVLPRAASAFRVSAAAAPRFARRPATIWENPVGGATIVVMIVLASIRLACYLVQVAY